MAGKIRDALVVIMVIAMALAAFAAGYLFNDALRVRSAPVPSLVSGDDFAVFWEALGRIEQSYLGDIPDPQKTTHGAIRGALEVLNDPYTVFIEPVAREHERQTLRGYFGGVGARIQRNEAGQFVLTPIPGNPAELAGIMEGDILLAIDGIPVTAELTVEEVARRIRGEKGTTVVLTVVQEGGSVPHDIEIVRDDIFNPSVQAHLIAAESTIGYIRLERFSTESGREVGEAIEALRAEGAQKLILDIRHNGGGLLDGAVAVADHFLTDGLIVYQKSRLEQERTYRARRETIAANMPLVLLIDGGTASASEIVAGALQDRDRAILVGTRTFGKGSVQLVYDLSDGSSIHVTSARWFTPAGRQIDLQGLEPDIEVEQSQEAIDSGRDDVLDRAIEYLRNLENG
jgi:carboxyl-terminal processing protease